MGNRWGRRYRSTSSRIASSHHLVVVSNLDLVYVDVSAPAAPVPRWSKTLGTPSNPPDRVHAFVAGGRSHLAYNLNGGTTLSLCRVEGVAADGEL